MAKRRKSSAGDDRGKALLAGLLGTAPATALTGLLTRAVRGKKDFTQQGPYISVSEAEKFPRKAFGKDVLVEFERGVYPSAGKTVRLPSIPKGKKEVTSLSAAAHEFGHAAGGTPQKVLGGLRKALFASPELRVPGVKGKFIPLPPVSPAHLPLILAAASPRKKDEKGVKEFVKKHPAALAAALSAIPLAEEAHASLKGLSAIRKLHGGRMATKALPSMARGFGTHALAHLPIVATIWGTGKIRDFLQSRREKTAGVLVRALKRPLLSSPRYFARIDEPGPVYLRRRQNTSINPETRQVVEKGP
jgi:hypothetical protein